MNREPFWRSGFSILLLALPWLVPPVLGPIPSMVPLLLVWVALSGFVLLSAKSIRRLENVFSIRAAWLLAALICSLFGLCQYFGLADFQPWISPARIGEAYANLRQRNQFATLCNIGLAVLLWRTASYPKNGRRVSLFAVLATILLMTASAASSSRTGLMQLLLLLALFVWWKGLAELLRDSVVRAAVAGYMAAALLFALLAIWQQAGGGIWGRVLETAPACSSRLVLWSNVLHLIQLKPWTGWGWGELSYAHFTTHYSGERFCDILDNAHNLPLHLAVELGVPFASLASALTLWSIARAKPWREMHPARRLAWAVLGLIGLHSLLEYPLWYGPFQMAVALSLFLLWVTPRERMASESMARLRSSVGTRFLIGGSAIILILCLYVGWQYWRASQIYMLPEQRAAAYKLDTLHKIQDNTLFRDQIHFAELTTTPLTADNATAMFDLAEAMLHFSPEPRVVQLLIESALLSKRDAEAAFYLQRFKAAFPKEYAAWKP